MRNADGHVDRINASACIEDSAAQGSRIARIETKPCLEMRLHDPISARDSAESCRDDRPALYSVDWTRMHGQAAESVDTHVLLTEVPGLDHDEHDDAVHQGFGREVSED